MVACRYRRYEIRDVADWGFISFLLSLSSHCSPGSETEANVAGSKDLGAWSENSYSPLLAPSSTLFYSSTVREAGRAWEF
jgi:hypothetical protein